MPKDLLTRKTREIEHGRLLSQKKPEEIWGWESPAGRARAIRRAGKIISGANLSEGDLVLEIGCGVGNFTESFARTGCNLFAADISPDLITLAKKKLIPQKNVTIIQNSYEFCAVHGPYDAIIGSSILHHLDIDTALPVLFDMLKPNGFFCFAEPNLLNPQIFLQKKIPWIKKAMGDSPDETAFISFSLARKLARAGFTDIEVIPFDWLHPSTPEIFINTIASISKILERIPIIREFSGSLLIKCKRP
jgi:SAM-dependent methyltransferase